MIGAKTDAQIADVLQRRINSAYKVRQNMEVVGRVYEGAKLYSEKVNVILLIASDFDVMHKIKLPE